ncbi:MAG: hypothetical protein WBA91_14330 [Paracoccaceae bacterium]
MTPRPGLALRALGAGALIAGLIILLVAVLVGGNTIGLPTQPIDRWFLSVLGLALTGFGVSAGRGAPLFGLLVLFFLLGGAAQLYLTEPLWFPTLHLRPDNGMEWVAFCLILAEALVALLVLAWHGPVRILILACGRLGHWRPLIFLGVTGILTVPLLGFLARGAGASYGLYVVAGGLLIAVHLALLIALGRVKSPFGNPWRISPLLVAGVTLTVSLLLGYFAFEQMAHVEDEVAYLFQARTFAAGALWAPVPPEALQPGLD